MKSDFGADFQEKVFPCGITQNDLKLIFLLSVNGVFPMMQNFIWGFYSLLGKSLLNFEEITHLLVNKRKLSNYALRYQSQPFQTPVPVIKDEKIVKDQDGGLKVPLFDLYQCHV